MCLNVCVSLSFLKKLVQSCVVIHIHPLSQCPCLFISLFLPAERRQSSGLKNTKCHSQPRFSCVHPSVPTLSPHIPLSVAGVTAGPDVAPFQSAFVLQMALASSFLLLSTSSWSLSCAAALQPRYLSLCKYEQLIN